METHVEVTMYGGSYRRYKVWRHIWRVKCMETHVDGKKFGELYRGYKVWRSI